jgi:uncharacterized protein (TIGR02145 family)
MNSNNGTNDYDIEKGQFSWSKAAYFLKSTNAWPADHEKNNKYGFSALPCGCLTTQGFKDMDKAAYFWTSDSYNRKFEEGGYIKCIGSHYQALSIRCVKD